MSTSELVTVQGVRMTKAAAECVKEAGVNVGEDVLDLMVGKYTSETLLALCLDLAEPNRRKGWREYVEAVTGHAVLKLVEVEARMAKARAG